MCKELTKTIKLQNVHNTIEETEANLEVLMPEFFLKVSIRYSDSHTNTIAYSNLRVYRSGFFNTNTLLSNYFAKCVATICECKVQ